MNTVNATVSQLVTVIRSQLTAVQPGPAGRRQAGARAGAGRRYTDRSMQSLIEARVRQIGPDDPQRGRKAFRVFLEAVLLTHFGEELMNDPKFYRLLEDVQGALEADKASAALVETAIAHLLSSKA